MHTSFCGSAYSLASSVQILEVSQSSCRSCAPSEASKASKHAFLLRECKLFGGLCANFGKWASQTVNHFVRQVRLPGQPSMLFSPIFLQENIINTICHSHPGPYKFVAHLIVQQIKYPAIHPIAQNPIPIGAILCTLFGEFCANFGQLAGRAVDHVLRQGKPPVQASMHFYARVHTLASSVQFLASELVELQIMLCAR